MPKFSLEEKVQVDAQPAHVRAIVKDFKQWEPWSPWLSADPNCKVEYADDGASYSWDGEVIGSGMMEVTRETDDAIFYDLNFFKPWKSQADVAFHFKTKDGGTEVAWSMDSSLPFFMFFMKKMMVAWVSADYRRGLAKLKDYAETGSVPSQNQFEGVGEGFVGKYVGIRSDRVPMDELGPRMSEQFEELKKWMAVEGIEPNGAPLSITHKFDMVNRRFDYTAAIPVTELSNGVAYNFVSGTLKAPKTFKVKHTGAYRHLSSAWSAAMMHQRSKQFRPQKGVDPFEVYVSDPTNTPEAELVTEIHLPAAG